MATITASASVKVLNYLTDLFQSASATNADLIAPAATADALGTHQALGAKPIIQNGLCVGYELWYYDTTNITGAALDYNGTTPEAFGTCTVAAGQETDTAMKAFAPNIFIRKNFTLAGSRCGNESDLVRELGLGLKAAIAVIRAEFNGQCIDFLDGSILPGPAPFWGTAGVGTDHIYEDGTWDEQTMSNMEMVAGDAGIFSGFRMLHGKNFRKFFMDSRYTRLNDNERSQQAQLDSYQHTWDTLALDARVGLKASYVYDPKMFGIFSMANYEGFGALTSIPQKLPGKEDMKVWAVPDPSLRFNILTEGGGIQSMPLEYVVTEQITCTGKNANGDFTHTYNYSVELRAMIDAAPAGTFNGTAVSGIIGFANNTPA